MMVRSSAHRRLGQGVPGAGRLDACLEKIERAADLCGGFATEEAVSRNLTKQGIDLRAWPTSSAASWRWPQIGA